MNVEKLGIREDACLGRTALGGLNASWKSPKRELVILARMSRSHAFRKCLLTPLLSVSERVWNRLPSSFAATSPMRRYGTFVHALVRLRSRRAQYHATFFLRNRPELRLISALLNRKVEGRISSRLTVLACSNGAEVYSILWTVRSARPDVEVTTQAVDISKSILEIAERGRYSLTEPELMNTPMFERLTEEEIDAMFDRDKEQVTVKPWIREGINWRVADASDPELVKLLGPQDIVVANRFLCHMDPIDAERCLRNIATLVAPGGYLFVSGIDLGIRTKVAIELGWAPFQI